MKRPHVMRCLAWIGGAACGLVVLGGALSAGVLHYTHRTSEVWLRDLFSGLAAADSGLTTCGPMHPEPRPCTFSELVAPHGGIATIDCFDTAPLSWSSWDCRVSFGDGKAVLVYAYVGWSKHRAHLEPDYY
jgi:hypothetical protein